MQKEKIIRNYLNTCKLIHRRRLADAIVLLRQLAGESGKEYITKELEELTATYARLLKHAVSGVDDPERNQVYNYLMRALLEMADSLREMLMLQAGTTNTYQMKKALAREQLPERSEAMDILESLSFDGELSSLLKDTQVGESDNREEREKTLENIFQVIWLADKYTEEEIRLLKSVCDSELLPWHDKSLVVSALSLSLLRYFDVNKFVLLFRFVEKQQPFVRERAMTGLFINSLKYSDRFPLYPVLSEKTRELKSLPMMEQHLETILVQFIKSRETEKVRKKWEEEILPEIMKMRPKIEEKLDLDNIFSDNPEEEKNPDWETMFEDAPDLLDKLQELTEMQMDGMDVFISAFSRLKHFPFFRGVSNWFVPFYAGNPAIQPMVKDTEKGIDLTPLLEKLEQTYFMCNSDKYSFCLNLSMVPDQQKTMMMNMLSTEMENISELEKDQDMLDGMARSKSIYTQYFQDLYRFHKLHPWRREFDDIFELDMDLYETPFIRDLVAEVKTIRNIAEVLFDKGFYEDALRVFLSILEKDKSNIELFEKIAFCYEKSGEFENALDYYQRADLIEAGRLWILKKMAYCCKYLNRWEDALNYYRQAESLDPENLKLQADIGQCLIHLEKYRDALDCYFKVEVLAPENHKIRRPLAWCSFLLGKFDTARDYLERLLAGEQGSHYDMMNLGHVRWCQGDPEEAFRRYLDSILTWKSIRDFEISFNEDRKHLAAHGIQEMELNLMMDHLKLEVRGRKNRVN